MRCALCSSANQAEFSSEMILHFRGLANIDRPGALVYAKLVVCLDCGFTSFTIPRTELLILRESIGTDLPSPKR